MRLYSFHWQPSSLIFQNKYQHTKNIGYLCLHSTQKSAQTYFDIKPILATLVASLMSLMASLVTTSRMQQCFNVPIDIYHEFLLLFYCCVLLEIKLTTTTTTTFKDRIFIKTNKMVVRPSYLYNRNPYTGKLSSLYWDTWSLYNKHLTFPVSDSTVYWYIRCHIAN